MNEINLKELKIVPYARKSKIDQEDKKILSIEGQVKSIEEYAKKHELNLLPIVEENASAYSTGREGFGKIMELIEKGRADAIMLYHATRAARNAMDGGWIIYQLSKGNLKALITPEKVYTNNADDKFMLHIHFAMAEKQSDDTSNFVKRDIQGKIDRKEIPNKVCAGYLNIDKEGRIAGKAFDRVKMQMLFDLKRPLKRIEQDPVEAPLWRKLGEEILEKKYTLGEAWKRAVEIGIKGSQYGRPVKKNVVKMTLGNPTLCGMIKNVRGIFEGDHDPIFTKEEFEEINYIIGNTERPVYKNNTFNKYNGLCFCGECGRQWTTESPKKRQGYIYLRCTKSRKDYKCSQKYLSFDEFEKQAAEILSEISLSDDLIDWSMEEIRKLNDAEFKNNDATRESIQSKINLASTQLDILFTKWSSANNANGELMSDEDYLKAKTKLKEEKEGYEKQLESTGKLRDNFYEDLEKFFMDARDFGRLFRANKDDQEAKRRMLIRVASNFTIKDQKVYPNFEKTYLDLKQIKQKILEANEQIEPQNMQEIYSLMSCYGGLYSSILEKWDYFRTFEWLDQIELNFLETINFIQS